MFWFVPSWSAPPCDWSFQAALDHFAQKSTSMHLSCTYLQKYVTDFPQPAHQKYIISDGQWCTPPIKTKVHHQRWTVMYPSHQKYIVSDGQWCTPPIKSTSAMDSDVPPLPYPAHQKWLTVMYPPLPLASLSKVHHQWLTMMYPPSLIQPIKTSVIDSDVPLPQPARQKYISDWQWCTPPIKSTSAIDNDVPRTSLSCPYYVSFVVNTYRWTPNVSSSVHQTYIIGDWHLQMYFWRSPTHERTWYTIGDWH